MKVDLYIGLDKLDQFNDEPVEVVSSVLDVSDITKNTGDYSRTFTVPASRKNNRIFKHWYNANIDNGFDSRTKIDGKIEIGGVPFKKGKFRLYKVSQKKGVADSYTINFTGNLVDIKDTVGDDKLTVLDLTSFNHDYNSANVLTGLGSSGLFGRDLVYTLMSKKRYFYNSNINVPDSSENLINIADNGGGSGVVWNDLRPSIKLIRIIEAIESYYSNTQTPILFSRDFFNTSEFNDIYLWLSPNKEIEAGGNSQQIDFDAGGNTWMDLNTNVGTYEVSNTAASNDTIRFALNLNVTPSAGYEDVPYDVIWFDGSDEYAFIPNNVEEYEQLAILSNQIGDVQIYQMSFAVRSVNEFKYTASLHQRRFGSGTTTLIETSTASENTTQSVFNVKDQLPDLKIIDLLKGLFQMFKLVVVPEDDGTIYINTLNSYYNQGKRVDISKYVDRSKNSVLRGDILNEIDLKFKDSETILAKQFRDINNRGYGDSNVKIEDENGKLLDGDSLTVELPFEQFVYERLVDLDDNIETNIGTCTIADDELNPIQTEAHLHYVSQQNTAAFPFSFVDDSSIKNTYNTVLNIPIHHITDTNPIYSLLFNNEFSTWNGIQIQKTLYSRHYENYILGVFNIKRRTFLYDAVLPLYMLTDLKLNDVIRVDGNDYRINTYTYNLLNGKTSFELINGLDNVLGEGNLIPKRIVLDNKSNAITFNLPNASDYTVGITDIGYGSGWVNVSNGNNNITFSVLENFTDDRLVLITLTLGFTAFQIILEQLGTLISITADNNIITADNNIITADHG